MLILEIKGKMDSLRELILSRTGVKELHLSIGNLIGLNQLRLVDCKNLTTLPCNIYELQSLVLIDVTGCSKLVTFPEIKGKMDSLTELNLRGSDSLNSQTELRRDGCKSLTELPNFTRFPILEEPNLYGCNSLVKVHQSIGSLHKLLTLNLRGCYNLVKLPSEISLKSLLALDLSDCTRLEEFPKIIGKIDSLGVLILSFTRVKELHPSVGNLIGLNQLYLVDCKNLTTLPCSIYELQNLEILDVSGCSKFVTFPEIKGKMNSLKKLYLSGSGITELHPSIGNLIGLDWLDLADCQDLTSLPWSMYELQNLEILDVSGCSKLVIFPEIKGKMNSLKKLYSSGSGITELHPSIGNLIGLNELYLDGCEDLTTIPCGIYELQNLEILNVSRCSNLVTFPTKASISHDRDNGSLVLPKLRVFKIDGCNLSTADFIGSLDCLEILTELDLSSNNFVSVPALGKFVNLQRIDLYCCKRLREIPELPPNIIEVNAGDCQSLERFLILPKFLKMRQMNLWNCHRFSYNLEKILLNNQHNSGFGLVQPESEIPKWFHCSKEVAANEKGPSSTCAISFEIPSKLNWENTGLAVCSVLERRSFMIHDVVDISINGVFIHRCSNLPSWRRSNWLYPTADHMWLTYIPLSDEMKGKVDQKGWGLTYQCQVEFYCSAQIKSCGVHLVCQPPNEYSNTIVMAAEPAHESVLNSIEPSNEAGGSSSPPSGEAAFPQIMAMQDMMNQLMTMQKELQKQMTMMVTVPITKEGKRLEAALGRSMEKAVKANNVALRARFQEKNEKLLRDRTQQVTGLIVNKDFPVMLEKMVKKEIAAVGPAVVRAITPATEKTIPLVISDCFQRGVGDKAVNQLEKSVNSKLEATVSRKIKAQFQTSGKQALQDALKSSMEASVVPAFEKSCKAMFEQVDATFQKVMVEHSTVAQQHFESAHSPLAHALREAISSASSVTQTLSGELADGQRKLVALAAAWGNSSAVNPDCCSALCNALW
ncbi:hypothetical protein ABKV19_025120 [Rosa sericea]